MNCIWLVYENWPDDGPDYVFASEEEAKEAVKFLGITYWYSSRKIHTLEDVKAFIERTQPY